MAKPLILWVKDNKTKHKKKKAEHSLIDDSLYAFYDMFDGRKLLIVTKHGKEKVIAPVVEKALGVKCYTSSKFDTDLFGTFTGEIERRLDPLSTARNKCNAAMSMNEFDLGIASEGSFGPHPFCPFIPANEEILILIDSKNKVEISVRLLSTDTNYHSEEVNSEKELLDFANQVQFPSHKLMMRKSKAEREDILKGIDNWNQLLAAFRPWANQHKTVYVETDMRAMNNPSRMKVIETAAWELVNKINSRCPYCKMPGFGIIDSIQGLPCSICKSPTKSIFSHVYKCLHCAYMHETKYPDGKSMESPQFCDICNP